MASVLSKFTDILKKQFIAGLLVIVPLIITWFVLRFLFQLLDGILQPLIIRWLGTEIPGLGAIITVALVFMAGILTTNFLGARLFRLWDHYVSRLPLVRVVYTASRQLIQAMLAPSTRAFSRAVMVEYPRPGVFMLGFIAGDSIVDRGDRAAQLRPVFMPTSPTPFSGNVAFFEKKDIYTVNISVEEAVKIIVSGGVVTPSIINMDDSADRS